MIDWEDLRGFAALARHGTLSGAARALGVEHATIARRVAALEAGLGLRLVDRRGRKLMLTPEGLRVADSAGRMEAEALAAERIALAARAELSGRVTLSAPPALAAARLAAPLARLVERSPGLVIEVRGEKREALLDRREAAISTSSGSAPSAFASTQIPNLSPERPPRPSRSSPMTRASPPRRNRFGSPASPAVDRSGLSPAPLNCNWPPRAPEPASPFSPTSLLRAYTTS